MSRRERRLIPFRLPYSKRCYCSCLLCETKKRRKCCLENRVLTRTGLDSASIRSIAANLLDIFQGLRRDCQRLNNVLAPRTLTGLYVFRHQMRVLLYDAKSNRVSCERDWQNDLIGWLFFQIAVWINLDNEIQMLIITTVWF